MKTCTAVLSSTACIYLITIYDFVTGDEKLNSICETVSYTTGCVALVDGSIARLCQVDDEGAVARGRRELIAICSQRRDGLNH